jgi:2-polyprenyl-6-methoxyphenol hydroxylase-like FAD-dependent oxidoreductase
MAAKKAVIIGAGIGGLAAAVALRRVGIDAEVWEQAGELRAAGTGLSVMSNALAAMRALGIDLHLGEERGAIVQRAEMLNPKGKPLVATPAAELYDRLGAPSVCIHRGDLQAALLEAADGAPIHLRAVATGFDSADDGVSVRFSDGREARGDLLIGADGIGSVIRAQLHGAAKPRYGGYFCWLATIPFDNPRMTNGLSAQYWGRGQRFGLHDIGQGRAYWWGTKTLPEHVALNKKARKEELAEAFRGWAPETQELIDITPEEEIVPVPAQDRPFIERWGTGRVTLLGDAAHPMLTALAQGGSSAIEDAVVLAMALQSAPDIVTGLRSYEDLRRDRTRWLVETSRKLGWLEQIENPALVLLRNLSLRLTPPAKAFKTFEKGMTWTAPGADAPRVLTRR